MIRNDSLFNVYYKDGPYLGDVAKRGERWHAKTPDGKRGVFPTHYQAHEWLQDKHELQ